MESKILLGIPEIKHGFGTLLEPIPAKFSKNWDQLRPQWKQVHGVSVGEAKQACSQLGEVDAVFTRITEAPIAVVTADCVPILLAHREGKTVAAVHAGWKGTQARILRKLWENLKAQGEKPKDWVAAVGPAIGPCCYEVSEELAEEFIRDFRFMDTTNVSPRFRYLDLPAINAWELKDLGLETVDLIRACTKCTHMAGEFQYHSYRREGSGSRQWSMISRE